MKAWILFIKIIILFIHKRCCFPQKQDISNNNQNEEMEVKNTDERTELINPNKSKNKRLDNKLKGQNEKDNLKTDIINLDKPTNSNRNHKILSNKFFNF